MKTPIKLNMTQWFPLRSLRPIVNFDERILSVHVLISVSLTTYIVELVQRVVVPKNV